MQHKSWSIIVLVITLVVANSGFLVAAEPQMDPQPSKEKLEENTITAIKVVGNEEIAEEEILNGVETTIGDNISYDQLQQDMQSIFDLGYFFDVKVNFKNHKDGVMLIFEVIENPQLSAIKITGNENVPDTKFKETIGLQTGEILNVNQLNQGVKELNKYYQEEGFVLAEIVDVTIKNEDELHIKVNEGQINKILISGNDKTKDYVIRRELSLEPGQVFNINQMWSDLRDVYNLGYFKDVKPKFNRVEDNPQAVNLEVQVEEAKTRTASLAGGYSGNYGWTGSVNLELDNFRGRGQNVKLKWQFGQKKNTYEIGFYEPWAFGSQTSVNFNLYNKDETEPSGKEVETKGGDITLGRPLTDNTQGYLKLNIDREKTKEADAENWNDWQDNRSLTLKTVRDTRDNVLSPRSGSKSELAIEKAGILGGDNDYTKYQADLRKYLPSGKDNSWAIRLKLGESSGDLTDHKYSLSGLDGIRGYDDDYYKPENNPEEEGFIGESVLASSLEYRFKIVDKVTGVSFVDAGRTFEDHIDLEELNDINYSAGLGVRFDTPMGQLGLDYGYAPEAKLDSKDKFSIRLGNRF
ncbi:BamA/OMP85 family outer membrane protein [Halanaerobaculum tunisiense]